MGPAPFDKWEIPGFGTYRTCLLPRVTPWARTMQRLHEHYTAGVLPFKGGLLEQPNAYLEAMEYLSQCPRPT